MKKKLSECKETLPEKDCIMTFGGGSYSIAYHIAYMTGYGTAAVKRAIEFAYDNFYPLVLK